MNRLTITLDDDLYAMARAYAVTHKLSLSKAISQLLRRRQEGVQAVSPVMAIQQNEPFCAIHPRSGFPVSRSDGRPITNEDVQRANDDEDVRHLEIMGLSPAEIARSLNS